MISLLLLAIICCGAYAAREVQFKYIVEFADPSKLTRHKSSISQIDSFYQVLESHGFSLNPGFEYTSSVFQGASFEVVEHTTDGIQSLLVSSKSTQHYLESLPEVKRVWPVTKYRSPTHGNSNLRRSTPDNDKPFDTSQSTRVDQLHQMGIYGEGAVVGILDTGVNYNHPGLGGGMNTTVIGGYDFTPGNFSNNPMDCAGHGTMVAGIIAGNSTEFMGIAPQAKIRAYRTAGCDGNSYSDAILQALAQAEKDEVDVINISLGADDSWSTSPMAIAAAALVERGIIVASSASNSGGAGPYSGEDIASGNGVLAVGSYYADEDVVYTGESFSTSGEAFQFRTFAPGGLELPWNGTYYAQPLTIDACDSSLNSTITGETDFLIIPKGNSCSLKHQADVLWELGISNALFYNYNFSSTDYNNNELTFDISAEVNMSFATQAFSDWVNDEISNHHPTEIELYFNEDGYAIPQNSTLPMGRMDFISSWGPTYDNKFYPSLSAPGGSILSTTIDGGYKIASGTSFSSPFVAGVAALFVSYSKQQNITSDNRALDFNARAMGTSKFTYLWDGIQTYPYAAPTIQQGAGIIDAPSILFTNTQIISAPSISLNDTQFRNSNHTIEIFNGNDESVTYRVRHDPTLTAKTLNSSGTLVNQFPQFLKNQIAQVTINPSTFTLQAGDTQKINVSFTGPQTTPDGLVFSGKLNITGDNNDTVGVPYMGKFSNDTQVLQI